MTKKRVYLIFAVDTELEIISKHFQEKCQDVSTVVSSGQTIHDGCRPEAA